MSLNTSDGALRFGIWRFGTAFSLSIQMSFLPFYIVTAVFGAIFVIGPLLVQRGANKGITRTCIMLTAFCMWIFWTIVFLHSTNPLIGPRLDNTTLAWMAEVWGDPATP